MNKKEYGQYYTTNYKYILQNMHIPPDDGITTIIEPFVGKGDLLHFLNKKKEYKIIQYDIEPTKENKNIIKKDCILYPPDYTDTFVLTNPPYLARNKAKNKQLFDKYNTNDLYKCFIKSIIQNPPKGGIIIIPVNFWSSIRETDIQLRKQFMEKFTIIYVNIFEEQVFNDTTCAVCSIQFSLKDINNPEKQINISFYPSNKTLDVILHETNHYTIGGEIYNIPVSDKYVITRLTKKNIGDKNTNIIVKCIDNNIHDKISFTFVDDNSQIYIDNTPHLTARTFMTPVITPPLSIEKQKICVEQCNRLLNEYREKYQSLFMSNFRESNSIARKRISFQLVYRIIGHILLSV